MAIKELLKKFRLTSIRSRLILGIAIVNVVLMLVFVLEMMNRQKEFSLKLNHDQTMGLSINLANTANSYVISYELARLQKLVSSYKEIPNLQYAFITSDDGIVLAHTNEKYLGLKATDPVSAKLKPINTTQVLLENNTLLDIASPILNHNEIVGWARISVSQKHMESNIAEIKQRGLLYILISLIVSFIFAVIVASGLSRGLQKLVTAARKIKGGSRDLRVGPSNSEEITQLGTAFNQMLDDISANEKLLSMVLENMPVGVFILDENGKVVSLNPAAQQIWEGAKYVDKGDYNVYKGWFPNGKEIESHEWGAAVALNENRAVLNQEAEIEGFDGSRKTILNSCIPLRDTNEKITGIISINVDITERKHAENEVRKINHHIGERIKELRCLYKMSQLSNDHNKTIQDIAKECVNIIPPSYQFPEITCARIEFEEKEFKSVDFVETVWKQEQNIISNDVVIGKVQVYYKKQMPEEVEGPFLSEERLLINSIADILGSSVERRKATELFKHQFENSPDIILIVNKDFKIESINRARPNGPSAKELIGMSSIDVLPEESQQMAREAILKCFETGQNQEIENALHSYKWVRSRFVPIIIDGVINHIMVIATDITERKIAEENLKRSEEKNRALIENISDTIILINEKMELTYQSPSFVRTGGYTLEDHRGKTIIDFIHPEDRNNFLNIFEKASASPDISIENQMRILQKGGNYIWIEGTITNLLNNESVKSLVVNYRDITERKTAQDEMNEMNERLRLLSSHLQNIREEERTSIAREVHDELGQQLTGLKMDVITHKRKNEKDFPEIAKDAEAMVKMIDEMVKTVRRIATELRPGILDDLGLGAALEWQGQEFEKRTGIKCIVETKNISDEYPRDINTAVFRIFQESLTNVTRHAEAKEVMVLLCEDAGNLLLEIKDDGKGISEERKNNKTSLGLLGMKERAGILHGDFSIKNLPEKGACVTLKIPFAP